MEASYPWVPVGVRQILQIKSEQIWRVHRLAAAGGVNQAGLIISDVGFSVRSAVVQSPVGVGSVIFVSNSPFWLLKSILSEIFFSFGLVAYKWPAKRLKSPTWAATGWYVQAPRAWEVSLDNADWVSVIAATAERRRGRRRPSKSLDTSTPLTQNQGEASQHNFQMV